MKERQPAGDLGDPKAAQEALQRDRGNGDPPEDAHVSSGIAPLQRDGQGDRAEARQRAEDAMRVLRRLVGVADPAVGVDTRAADCILLGPPRIGFGISFFDN